jgi:hypothetical protein
MAHTTPDGIPASWSISILANTLAMQRHTSTKIEFFCMFCNLKERKGGDVNEKREKKRERKKKRKNIFIIKKKQAPHMLHRVFFLVGNKYK